MFLSAVCKRYASSSVSKAVVRLPAALSAQLKQSDGGVEEVMSKKGPVFSTSVVCDPHPFNRRV